MPVGLGTISLRGMLRHVRCDCKRIVVVESRVHREKHPIIILEAEIAGLLIDLVKKRVVVSLAA
jgi:hypothetical protein